MVEEMLLGAGTYCGFCVSLFVLLLRTFGRDCLCIIRKSTHQKYVQ
jgi:hypothetical protein